jgi:hypothetical protein
MAQPDPKSVYVDEFLTDVLIAYLQKQTNFFADKLFPVVDVQQQTGIFPKYDKSAWLRDEAKVRGDTEESAGSGWDTDLTLAYNCEQISVHKDIGPQARANQKDPIDLDSHAARFVGQQLMMRRDRDFATAFMATGVWDTDLTPATKWDAGGSTPVEDVTRAAEDVANLTGFKPNKILCGNKVFNELRNHPDILNRTTPTSPRVPTAQALAEFFDVDEFIVARSVRETATEGATSAVQAIAPDKRLLLVYATEAPSILEPSAGYSLAWTGLLGAGAYSGRIARIPMPLKNNAVRVEGDIAIDMQVVAPDLGVLFDAAIA